MAIEVCYFACTVPAGTPQAAPIVVPMTMPSLVVDWVEWDVPPGANGDVGFLIASQGAQVLPYSVGGYTYIVASDRYRHWDLENQPTSGSWEFRGYNIGILPHTVSVTFGLSLPSPPAPTANGPGAIPLIPSGALAPVGV